MLDLIILLKIGVDLLINDKSTWFYPCISIIIADWPEASTFCLTYKSSNSKLPYYFCLVTRDNLANINLLSSDTEPRIHQNMCNYFKENNEKSVYIESVYNFFWNMP